MTQIDRPMSDELIGPLMSRLQSLDSAARAAAVDEFAAVLDRRLEGRFSQIHAQEDQGSLNAAVVLAEWASDAGLTPARQRLDVDLQPGKTAIAKTTSATGRPLLSNGFLGADLIHVPAGEGFAPHTHPGDHLLFVVGGHGTITAAGEIQQTSPGQVYMVDGLVPHAVGAITDHVLLSIGTAHRALDSAERQLLTSFNALLSSEGFIRCRICDVVGCRADELRALGCSHAPTAFEGADAQVRES